MWLVLGWIVPAAAQGAEAPAGSSGQTEPLWELGAGAGGLLSPDYPGSSEHHVRGLALPYVVYRGDVFRLGDGQAARAVAFESEHLELDLSFDAAFDAESKHNDLREDMPDLDYLFQVGPQLIVKLGEFRFDDGSHAELRLALQARSVFSTDIRSLDHRGYVFEPQLRYRHYGWLFPRLETTVSIKPVWATRKLHTYFYEVEPEFALPDRPFYQAESGYFGTEVNLFGNYDLSDRLNVFFGLQTAWHYGAANTGSPLFRERVTVGAGVGFVWTLLRSQRQVAVD